MLRRAYARQSSLARCGSFHKVLRLFCASSMRGDGATLVALLCGEVVLLRRRGLLVWVWTRERWVMGLEDRAGKLTESKALHMTNMFGSCRQCGGAGGSPWQHQAKVSSELTILFPEQGGVLHMTDGGQLGRLPRIVWRKLKKALILFISGTKCAQELQAQTQHLISSVSWGNFGPWLLFSI